MELILKGIDDWCIDTAHNGKTRWADVYRKVNGEWEQFAAFIGDYSLGDALDTIVEEGLEMTEDQVCEAQQDMPGNIYAEVIDVEPNPPCDLQNSNDCKLDKAAEAWGQSYGGQAYGT